jgi:hypothetical protein
MGESYLLRLGLCAGGRDVRTEGRPEVSCAVDQRRACALLPLPFPTGCDRRFAKE